MERLMKALGDEGLDEFDQAQLGALGGEEESDSEGEGENGSDEEDAESIGGEDESEEEAEEQDEDEDDAEEDEDDAEEEVALEDVEDVDDDVVPRQKVEIDNHAALARIRESIQLDASLPWTETLVLSYPETIDVDVNDDLNREVAFYKQALHGANAGRALAAKHKFPFTRPSDYFAEMVKTDAHMERIRQRLLDESSSIKKSEDKRKEREGKKFGKQVQIEKLKERERSKKDMEERLKGLKRKRKDVLDNPNADDDAFDVAVEDAISDRPVKRGRGGGSRGLSRQSRDKKFGFGGGDRRSKQNTRESTDNFDSGSRKGSFRGGARGGRGGGRGGRGGGSSGGRHSSKRLGKSRRITARSKT
ncbi:eukaryotic rRNA processing protein EBP2-domain-containing protein [Desarmillaria tabescens]|uniref:Eukaryotic rRNA processing protein EBP2-domain-containing protein n=1 Tax=Armillaria tabescens TaxID=1929756 RepID=A0AA39KFF2_ARMTA|nr:eukaryotic rRNA processing protein EBP2-domain-containing protein [Desarmillaria tabescens]KAK0457783.1 eukaryotic rRNA processing protein EBP2-domain-containing protein [Desarmillaria tabescens]